MQKKDAEVIKDLGWLEDLEWKTYYEVFDVFENVIQNVTIELDYNVLNGIAFHFENNKVLKIVNGGDVITAFITF